MSKFDELKKLAEAATEIIGKTHPEIEAATAAFAQAVKPGAVVELLAIQAQLVEALRNLVIAADNLDPQSGMPIGYQQLTDATTFADAALAAAGAQP